MGQDKATTAKDMFNINTCSYERNRVLVLTQVKTKTTYQELKGNHRPCRIDAGRLCTLVPPHETILNFFHICH
jgi:hypothetical protein